MKRANYGRERRPRKMISQDEDIVSLRAELTATRDRLARAIEESESALGVMMRQGRIAEEIGGREVLNVFRSAMKGRD